MGGTRTDENGADAWRSGQVTALHVPRSFSVWRRAFPFLLLTMAAVCAEVTGQVTLQGTPVSQDETFVAAASGCGESPVRHTENWKIGPQGQLADVVVWIINPKLSTIKINSYVPAQINQIGCRYVPHVIAIEAAVPLQFINGDKTLHNVRAQISQGATQPLGETVFNFGQSYQGQMDERSFDDPGLYSLRCDVHSWMQAWVMVLSHPSCFGVTGPDGTFHLALSSSLADGDYQVKAWHAKFSEPLVKTVHVKGGTAAVNFQFDGAKSL